MLSIEMPLRFRPRRLGGRKKKPAMKRKRMLRAARRVNTNSSQVFTETFKASTECYGVNAQGEVAIPATTSGVGVKLLAQMNRVPQVQQYGNLYQSYKILRVKFLVVPKWTGEAYNEASIGTGAGLGITETPRFAYAINDNDQSLAAPLNELSVLQNNGCKVRLFNKPVSITIRPKPMLEQVVNQPLVGTSFVNTYQKGGQWIEFDGTGTTVQHIGIDGFFSAQNNLVNGFINLADIYVSVSFVCRDPR